MKVRPELLLIIIVIAFGALGLYTMQQNNELPENEPSANSIFQDSDYNNSDDNYSEELRYEYYTASNKDSISIDNLDTRTGYNHKEDTIIEFNEDSVSITGEGASVSNASVVINAGGRYLITGHSSNTAIEVNAKDEFVHLIIGSLSISSSYTAPIKISKVQKCIITLVGNNTITEVAVPNQIYSKAAIYSKKDLTINGDGNLTINAINNNGISCDEYLKIITGNITVNAPCTAIKAEKGIIMLDGSLTLNAGLDGLKTTDDNDGIIFIKGGNLNITSDDECLQSAGDICLDGGECNLRAIEELTKCNGYLYGESKINRIY